MASLAQKDNVPLANRLLLTLLARVTPVVRDFIEIGFKRQWVKSGDTVFKAGDDASSMYVVMSGRLLLLRSTVAGTDVVGDVGRGETAGESGLLTGGEHKVGAVCVRDSELLRVSDVAYRNVVKKWPAISMILTKVGGGGEFHRSGWSGVHFMEGGGLHFMVGMTVLI